MLLIKAVILFLQPFVASTTVRGIVLTAHIKWLEEYAFAEWSIRLEYEYTVYPKKYAHGFCFAVLCCGYTLTDFPISIRVALLALGQSLDMDKYFMWIQ